MDPLTDCKRSVGRCPVMSTCPVCKRQCASRSGMYGHLRSCTGPMDNAFRQVQWEHWNAFHEHWKEKQRRPRGGW